MKRVVVSWVLLVVSTLGFAVCMTLWLMNLVSTRAMVGITLALSWAALQYEAFNAVQISHDAHQRDEQETPLVIPG